MNLFDKQKENIKRLANEDKFEEAIEQCDLLIKASPEVRPDALRLRAYVYSLQGMYGEAVADREALIDSGNAMLRDYYLLGDNSLSLGNYASADKWLMHVLELGKQQNETWFEGAALFLLSYAKLQLGQLTEAAECLDRAVSIDPECALPIRGRGIVNHQSLREEIIRRTSR